MSLKEIFEQLLLLLLLLPLPLPLLIVVSATESLSISDAHRRYGRVPQTHTKQKILQQKIVGWGGECGGGGGEEKKLIR